MMQMSVVARARSQPLLARQMPPQRSLEPIRALECESAIAAVTATSIPVLVSVAAARAVVALSPTDRPVRLWQTQADGWARWATPATRSSSLLRSATATVMVRHRSLPPLPSRPLLPPPATRAAPAVGMSPRTLHLRMPGRAQLRSSHLQSCCSPRASHCPLPLPALASEVHRLRKRGQEWGRGQGKRRLSALLPPYRRDCACCCWLLRLLPQPSLKIFHPTASAVTASASQRAWIALRVETFGNYKRYLVVSDRVGGDARSTCNGRRRGGRPGMECIFKAATRERRNERGNIDQAEMKTASTC